MVIGALRRISGGRGSCKEDNGKDDGALKSRCCCWWSVEVPLAGRERERDSERGARFLNSLKYI